MTNLEIIQNLYESFAKGDVTAVLAGMHEDIIWNEAENFPYADRNPYVGHQAILEGVFTRCLEDWEGFAAKMDKLYDAGNTVFATGRYEGINNLTGKPMNPQAVHIWTVEDGKIIKFQQHIDTFNVINAMT
ncbi:nuclear transport factor 2 family protein [uncultured Paraglaciecola sp.]|uniref:nuclear transport factor 2 family protein n=1 Tax=uncultured Paraglaciecola sp. TaxID=1765024 RepID=UPI002636BB92|nr:nuclear transport factor 2 family protein [uncultured Paraglaciecola sp.]